VNRTARVIEWVCIVLLFILAVTAYRVLTAGADTYSLPMGPTR
jgi:hypothetical protein